jgi:hypothetical protein
VPGKGANLRLPGYSFSAGWILASTAGVVGAIIPGAVLAARRALVWSY